MKKTVALLLALLFFTPVFPLSRILAEEAAGEGGEVVAVEEENTLVTDLLRGEDGTYDPEGTLTVAECIRILTSVHQYRERGEISLIDGAEGRYDNYIAYALHKDILHLPLAEGDYDETVTRALAAMYFTRILTRRDKVLNTGTVRYLDVRDEGAWYYEDIYTMYRYGIMTGGTDIKFHPTDYIKRSEMAVMVERMIDPEKRVVGDIPLVEKVVLPVLMYHNFADSFGDYTITEEIFRSHLTMFQEEGYHAITFRELIAYADGEDNLPEKPILLTSDDGYSGVVDIALPLLVEFDMKMSVAVIGSSIGATTGIPHFTLDEVKEQDTEGRLELLSHSYALHDEENGMRGAANVTISKEDHAEAVRTDCEIMKGIAGGDFPMMTKVFVYPYGSYTADSEAVLASLGYRATVTTSKGIAVVRPGTGLGLIPRITAEWYTTGEALLKKIR